MKMPRVFACDATECAYNKDQQCHALAITVGDTKAAQCDTFWQSSEQGGDPDAIAGVGACHVSDCQYNKHLECSAPSVKIGHCGQEVDCLTFSSK